MRTLNRSNRNYKILLSLFLTFECLSLSLDAKASEAPSLRVSDPWSYESFYREIKNKYGSQGIEEKELGKKDGLLIPLYVPPLNILSLVYFKIVGRDSDNIARGILEYCRKTNVLPEQISCITQSVSEYVDKLPRYRNGITFDGRTFCAVAANLFSKIFNSLEIGGSRVDFLDGSITFPNSLHVVSVLYLTDHNGTVFSYVIEVGKLPNVLFPLSRAAIRYHTNKESKTTLTTFPTSILSPGTKTGTENRL